MAGTLQTRIDDALGELTPAGVPGCSAVVVSRDGVEAVAARGLRSIDRRAPATPETVYLWFSMTKIVTATAVMQLAERGKLGLDDPVARWVPGFPAPRAGRPDVRIHHLLSHSAGLANPLPVRWVHPAGEAPRGPHEFAAALLGKHRRLRSPAGAKAVYSNLGYIALGEAISAAGGVPYDQYVRDEILTPLSMTRTGFSYEGFGEDVAVGYQRRLHPMTPLFRFLLPKGIVGRREDGFVSFNRFLVDGPAYGGLVGSVSDAARFLTMHVRGGELDGVRVLAPGSVERMQTIHATGRGLEVGYGWFRRGRERSRPERFVEHLGGGGGFWNMMRLYPDRGLGVLCMGNSTAYDHKLVARAATET